MRYWQRRSAARQSSVVSLMKYPDGTTVKIGDHVWWDGGLGTGYVTDVLESPDEYTSAGLDSPGIMIAYDDNAGKGGTFVGYPERYFDDEGVGKLTPSEEKMIEDVVAKAKAVMPGTDVTFGVFADYQSSAGVCTLKRWKVAFYRSQSLVSVIAVDPGLTGAEEIGAHKAGIFPAGMLIRGEKPEANQARLPTPTAATPRAGHKPSQP